MRNFSLNTTQQGAHKVCIVSSSGGHLVKTYALKNWWKKYNRFWVSRNDLVVRNLLQDEKVYYGFFPEQRSWLNLVKNTWLAFKLFRKEKPTILFSMGAGVAIPFFLVAKVFRTRSIFVETFIRLPNPTVTGMILYHLADIFIVQNKQLLKRYPRAKFFGSCI